MKKPLLIAAGAFALGYLLGHGGLPLASWLGSERASVEPAAADPAPAAGAVSLPGADPAADLAVDAVAAELHAYERQLRAGRLAEAARSRDGLVARVRAWSATGAGREALRLLGDLVAIDPYDGEFLLLESELRQQQGLLVEAIEPLLVLLQQTDEPDKVGRAREQLRLLVDVYEIQLSNRRDYPGLVRFFEHLVARDPGWDGHRLKLARWLLLQGRVAEAERVAQELGSVGITDVAREDLLAEIGLARDGLPLERSAHGLYVSATIDGRPARLLVDTGASTTVVSRDLALALGSRALDAGRDVGVRTAGGVVRGELHRIRNLRIGGLELPALDVLVLEHLPADSDGLLGMDVLGRLPSGVLPATLLGRPPGSG